MALAMKGLCKLVEECGELVQIAAKKQQCMNTDIHFDGKSIASRMEDEMGDVLASIEYTALELGLDKKRIRDRANLKLALFRSWKNDENEPT